MRIFSATWGERTDMVGGKIKVKGVRFKRIMPRENVYGNFHRYSINHDFEEPSPSFYKDARLMPKYNRTVIMRVVLFYAPQGRDVVEEKLRELKFCDYETALKVIEIEHAKAHHT